MKFDIALYCDSALFHYVVSINCNATCIPKENKDLKFGHIFTYTLHI